MRTVILVGLILHLVITVVKTDGDYAFGDIISFPRTFAKIPNAYKHFAVYVGPKNVFRQGDEKDLFHRIRKPIDGKYCVFGSLKNEPQHQKDNYLDGKLKKANETGIIKNIQAMMKHCGNYKLFKNNCEHLATYVRYGRAYSKQRGTPARFVCLFLRERTCPAANEAVKKMEDEDPEFQEILSKLHENSENEAEDWAQDQAAAG